MTDRTYVVFLPDGSAIRMSHRELEEKHSAKTLAEGTKVLIGNRMVPPEQALSRGAGRSRIRDEMLTTRASTPLAIAAEKKDEPG